MGFLTIIFYWITKLFAITIAYVLKAVGHIINFLSYAIPQYFNTIIDSIKTLADKSITDKNIKKKCIINLIICAIILIAVIWVISLISRYFRIKAHNERMAELARKYNKKLK